MGATRERPSVKARTGMQGDRRVCGRDNPSTTNLRTAIVPRYERHGFFFVERRTDRGVQASTRSHRRLTASHGHTGESAIGPGTIAPTKWNEPTVGPPHGARVARSQVPPRLTVRDRRRSALPGRIIRDRRRDGRYPQEASHVGTLKSGGVAPDAGARPRAPCCARRARRGAADRIDRAWRGSVRSVTLRPERTLTD
jgi:hypothetical protein